MKLKQMIVAAIGAAAMACGAYASSITVDNVAQRWPWNNKLDITYTVDGGQDVSAGVYAHIEFTAHIGSTNIVIDGVHEIGANDGNIFREINAKEHPRIVKSDVKGKFRIAD